MLEPTHIPLPEVPHVVPVQPADRRGSWGSGVRRRLVARVRRRTTTGPEVELAPFLHDGAWRDREVLRVREKAFGPDHPDVASALHILGARYHLAGRHAEAETLYQRALNIRLEALGREHPSTIETWEDLGDLWRDAGELFRARAAYESALAGVTDPARHGRKRDEYTARLAHQAPIEDLAH